MRTTFLIALLAASCGPPTTPPAGPVGNTGPEAPANAPSSVSGKVTDAATAEPVEGATVVLDRPDSTQADQEQVTITVRDGSYTFAAVEPGRYRLSIYFADMTVQRSFAVSGPTVIDQQMPTNGSGSDSGVMICASAAFASCAPRP